MSEENIGVPKFEGTNPEDNSQKNNELAHEVMKKVQEEAPKIASEPSSEEESTSFYANRPPVTQQHINAETIKEAASKAVDAPLTPVVTVSSVTETAAPVQPVQEQTVTLDANSVYKKIKQPLLDENGIYLPSKGFTFLSFSIVPLLVFFFFLTLQVIFTIKTRTFLLPEETSLIATYNTFMQNGSWFFPTLHESIHATSLPLFYLFIHAVKQIPSFGILTDTMYYHIATALSALFFITSVWFMARVVARTGKSTALVAGLVVMGSFFALGIAHVIHPYFLFAALITFGLSFIFRGLEKTGFSINTLVGFLLIGIATLVQGPFAIAFALFTTVFWCLRTKHVRTLIRVDVILGYLLMLLPIGLWLGMLSFEGDQSFVKELFSKTLIDAVYTSSLPILSQWPFYALALPLVCLPWIFGIIINATRTPAFIKHLKITRIYTGDIFLFWYAAGALAVLLLVMDKSIFYLLPVMAPLAIYTASSITTLTRWRQFVFQCITAITLIIIGIVLALIQATPYIPTNLYESYLPESVNTQIHLVTNAFQLSHMAIPGTILIIAGFFFLIFAKNKSPFAFIIQYSFFITIFAMATAILLPRSMETSYPVLQKVVSQNLYELMPDSLPAVPLVPATPLINPTPVAPAPVTPAENTTPPVTNNTMGNTTNGGGISPLPEIDNPVLSGGGNQVPEETVNNTEPQPEGSESVPDDITGNTSLPPSVPSNSDSEIPDNNQIQNSDR